MVDLNKKQTQNSQKGSKDGQRSKLAAALRITTQTGTLQPGTTEVQMAWVYTDVRDKENKTRGFE